MDKHEKIYGKIDALYDKYHRAFDRRDWWTCYKCLYEVKLLAKKIKVIAG